MLVLENERVFTCRTAAAIVAVAVTGLTGLWVGAGVLTWPATFQKLHVVWASLVCEDSLFLFVVSSPGS